MKRANSISLSLALSLVCFVCLCSVAAATSPILNNVRPYVVEQPETAPSQDEWTFAADRVVGDHTSEYVEGHGNCTLSMGDNQLQADFARYYHTTGWVYLKGNLRARWGGDFLQADEGEFDLSNMTGWLKNGKLFMAKPHMYVDAERVGKAQGDSYTFENAKVTACDGDSPAWAIEAEEGHIELDGNVQLYRSTFKVKDTSVFYWPYASLPGRQKRSSGFLTPYLASSTKLGLQMNLPYYWAINDESDATFYQNFMSKRGYMQGAEFRHVDDVATKGMWKFEYLRDNKTASSESDESTGNQGDGLARPNENRWWLRSKYDGWLSDPKIKVKLDLDLVSDQNFLRDFRDGPSGYDKNREEFLDAFGRDLDKKDDTTRTSVALLTRSWDRFGTAAKLQYVQNLEFMNGNGDDKDNTTVQTVPELEAFAFQQSIPGTPLEVAAETKYDYFHRNKGHSGHRIKFTPQAKLPLAVGGFTFIPYAGANYTGYDLTSHDPYGIQEVVDEGGRTQSIDTSQVKEGRSSRTTWDAGFSAFTELNRVFALDSELEPTAENAGKSGWSRVKHSIIPRLSYEYTPTITGQDKLPYFDEDDRINGRNLVTYSLTNVLDRRKDSVTLVPGEGDGPQPRLVSNYLDFLNFRLEQSYDQNEASRNDKRDKYERRPFTDVLAALTINPAEYIQLTSRNWYSVYIGDLTETENTIKLYQAGLGEVWLEYDYRSSIDEYKRYRDSNLSIIELGAEWEMTREFTLRGKYRHDFNGEKDLERSVVLVWFSDCYSLNFGFTSKPDDLRYEFGFNIMSF